MSFLMNQLQAVMDVKPKPKPKRITKPKVPVTIAEISPREKEFLKLISDAGGLVSTTFVRENTDASPTNVLHILRDLEKKRLYQRSRT